MCISKREMFEKVNRTAFPIQTVHFRHEEDLHNTGGIRNEQD